MKDRLFSESVELVAAAAEVTEVQVASAGAPAADELPYVQLLTEEWMRKTQEAGLRLASIRSLLAVPQNGELRSARLAWQSERLYDEAQKGATGAALQVRSISRTYEHRLSTEEKYARMMRESERFPNHVVDNARENAELIDFLYLYGFADEAHRALLTQRGSSFTQEEMAERIPFLYQWDARWGYAAYGTSVIGITGCGPTCLSMVMLGLTGDPRYTPRMIADYAEKNGYYESGEGTRWSLFQTYAEARGLRCLQIDVTERNVLSELEKGHVLICSMGPGVFTAQGHFVVIEGLEDGKLIIHDPNNMVNSSRRYTYAEIRSDIIGAFTFWKPSAEELEARD
ncbi:MAG: C39 family peptidase [Lachnospiraceae bacterium]|nr:C39 family peptidase [Lachnospiraceae bacterium]